MMTACELFFVGQATTFDSLVLRNNNPFSILYRQACRQWGAMGIGRGEGCEGCKRTFHGPKKSTWKEITRLIKCGLIKKYSSTAFLPLFHLKSGAGDLLIIFTTLYHISTV